MDFMRYSRNTILLAIMVFKLAACVQAEDPGTANRYSYTFTSPASVMGKKFRWSQMPVRLRYNNCTTTGCNSAVEGAVKRGLDFWKNTASLYGEIQTDYADPADIQIVYTNSLGGNVIGVCSASLAQNTVSGAYYIVTPLTLTIATTVGGQPIAEKDLEFVAAHEMGHCLGLWDHSPTDGDLMYAYLTGKTTYTARDLNTLRWLYTQKSDLGTIPSSALALADMIAGETILSPPLLFP